MKVIDTSAFLMYVFREEGWDQVREELRKGVVSVDLLLKEALNAILTRLRRGDITIKEAEAMGESLKDLWGTAIEIRPEIEFVDDAFAVAKQKAFSLYDALFIALAKSEGFSLLTLDRTQARVARELKVSCKLVQ